jgi:hypothetical protein
VEVDTAEYLKSLFGELTVFEGYEDVSKEFAQLSTYMRDFAGSEDMFERLREEHLRAKRNGIVPLDQAGSLGMLKQKAWSFLRKNERAFNLLARARGHQIPTSVHRNVPSIAAASNILSGYLAKQARPVKDLSPIQVSSPYFLKEKRVSVSGSA